MHYLSRFMILIFVGLLLAGCSKESSPEHPRKELLIYCGITMIKPMREISDIVENKMSCTVKIIKGGSGNLLRAIEINQVGDLYLPGSENYMDTCMEKELVKKAVCVGYNRAVMVVKEGNPLNIKPGDPACFTNSTYSISFADNNSGSIGREATSIFQKRGVLKEAIGNAPLFTTDSKDITKAVASGNADLGINWLATTMWPENTKTIDALNIDDKYTSSKRLMLGKLRYSQCPDAADLFIQYAGSPQGQAIFRKYGFLLEKETRSATKAR